MKAFSHDILRAAELAALATYPLIGCGDKNRVDDAAVVAMRDALQSLDIDGTVVIGEGELDEAPMLYVGEKLGTQRGPGVDIAVDPVEGTRMVALGQSNALVTLAVAPENTLLSAPDMYMEKLVVGKPARGVIDLEQGLEWNLRQIAKAQDKRLDQLLLATLDKPRHQSAIELCKQLGVRVIVLPDGDVAASVLCCQAEQPIDVMYTIGGAPEGVVSACVAQALEGDMQARLLPFSQAKGVSADSAEKERIERVRCDKMGVNIGQVYPLSGLVKAEDVTVALCGITQGDLCQGITATTNGLRTQTCLLNAKARTISKVETVHFA